VTDAYRPALQCLGELGQLAPPDVERHESVLFGNELAYIAGNATERLHGH
jgi:hypothetical protein